ncbi:50S ribosomal protein L30e-like protein [Obelidium mucronatum]|nr:50S ribosomal protein L30e-like protein [Obelidium mucronatum]
MAKDEKKSKKEKKQPVEDVQAEGDAADQQKTDDAPTYEQRVLSVNPIAHPLASKKLTKKVYKAIKKASKSKAVKRGVKEIVKGLRKGSKGIVVLAGDISPIDVITHLPVLCEENSVPYIYTPSKADLGAASNTKRPTSCVMIVTPSSLKNKEAAGEYKESFDELNTEVQELNEKMITTV